MVMSRSKVSPWQPWFIQINYCYQWFIEIHHSCRHTNYTTCIHDNSPLILIQATRVPLASKLFPYMPPLRILLKTSTKFGVFNLPLLAGIIFSDFYSETNTVYTTYNPPLF